MTDVITFWKSITVQLWALIGSQWILSISVLITVLGWVISLINTTRNNKS